MASNEEKKGMSIPNRALKAKEKEKKKEPAATHTNKRDQHIASEVGRKAAEIDNEGFLVYCLGDLNDEINNLILYDN
ncbi:hypothetical protein G4B88_006921 [Cannabis sativa]|uniref:Uncharacterized protein n=1 Tax=Cannabis sativa TaxID=3483 RepID=A0A7J6G3T1_CANSA|nr:hypothetical protein G4B88_028651 [Cannabis sativa]KAF4377641.1 hypothetical protein G4B88_006921 [Cannabis sativa]